jgi:hypothetical protein
VKLNIPYIRKKILSNLSNLKACERSSILEFAIVNLYDCAKYVQNWGGKDLLGWLQTGGVSDLRVAEIKIMMIDKLDLNGDRQIEMMVKKLKYG